MTCNAANTVTIAVCLKVVALLNIDATNITYNILTNSAGCTDTGPSVRTRLAPYILFPKRTAVRSASPTPQYIHPIFLKLLTVFKSHGTAIVNIVPATAIANCLTHFA